MPWKLVEIPDDDTETLTDSELIAVGFALKTVVENLPVVAPANNVYSRAWDKLSPSIAKAADN
jgi:hypothetical protein